MELTQEAAFSKNHPALSASAAIGLRYVGKGGKKDLGSIFEEDTISLNSLSFSPHYFLDLSLACASSAGGFCKGGLSKNSY
jgi:hypothetical protein